MILPFTLRPPMFLMRSRYAWRASAVKATPNGPSLSFGVQSGRVIVCLATLFISTTATAQTYNLTAAIEAARGSPGEERYLEVGLPDCVLAIQELEDRAEHDPQMLRVTLDAELREGWARGTIAFDKSAGNTLVEVVCGSGLARVVAKAM